MSKSPRSPSPPTGERPRREVEAQIVEPQEQALRGTPGLKELNAWANAGNSWLTLRFKPGTDMQATLIEVISRMNQLPPMPRDAQAPVISLGEDGGDSAEPDPVVFLRAAVCPAPQVRSRIIASASRKYFARASKSVPGVSSVRFATGGPEELQILFDPNRAAELGVPIPRIAALAGNSDDVSGGFVDIGRRQYTVRFAGRYTPEELSQLVLEWRDGRPVRLGDVATGRGEATRSHGSGRAERQSRHRHSHHEGERRERSRDARCREGGDRTAAHRPARADGSDDRAVVRPFGVHQRCDRSRHRQPAFGRGAGGARAVVLRARQARHAASRTVDSDLPAGDA